MSEQFKPDGRYYAVGDYHRGTVMDWERKIPIATVITCIDGAKTQSALDGAQFIADLLNSGASTYWRHRSEDAEGRIANALA